MRQKESVKKLNLNSMKSFLSLAILFLAGVGLCAAGHIVVSGKITNHTYYFAGGIQVNTPAKIIYYNILGDEVVQEGPVNNSGSYSFSFHMTEPTLAYFEYGPDQFHIFIEPGQRIKIDFDAVDIHETIRYSGDGSGANKYFVQANGFYSNQLAPMGLEAKDIKSRRLSYLQSYIEENPVSSTFANWAKAEIEYGYANEALLLTSSDDDKTKIYVQHPVSNDDAVYSRQFLGYVDNYVNRLYQLYGEGQDRWTSVFDLTKNNLKGKTLDMYLTKVMNKAIIGQNSNMSKMYIDYVKLVKNQDYKLIMSKAYSKVAVIYNATIPDGANLKNLQGSGTTIAEMLNPYQGKVVLIDFWASWCKPCIQEMERSRMLKLKYGSSFDVIYVSLDNSEKPWMASIANNNLQGNHFLINKYIRAQANELFNMFTVPHYVIVDKYGSFVNTNAASPSDPQLQEDINFYLSY